MIAQICDVFAIEGEGRPQLLGTAVGLKFQLGQLGQHYLVLQRAWQQMLRDLSEMCEFISE